MDGLQTVQGKKETEVEEREIGSKGERGAGKRNSKGGEREIETGAR